VEAFLHGELHFTEIVPACRSVLDAHRFDPEPTLEKARGAGSLGTRGGSTLGMHLMANDRFGRHLSMVGIILKVAAGLGAVIFVHELGHFLVAKACGVKVEKFMIGFDIGGLQGELRRGETVYGIGILPLGGYVKMLGQDDDPAHIKEQMAKVASRRA